MRMVVGLIKGLGISLVCGASLLGLFVILGSTRYSPYLVTYLELVEHVAVFVMLIGLAALASIGGVILLRSRDVKKAGIPFIALFAFIIVAAPVTGITIVETQVIKGEIDLQRISALYNTAAEWEARSATIRQGILKGAELDPLPTRTALNATMHGLRVHGNYSVENVFFESLPGFFVTGNLYRPAGAGPTGLHPAVLIPHGHHNDDGRFDAEIQQLGASFARLGANTFTYDMVGYGESMQVVHESSHVLALQLWNSMRVVDFMVALNDTDPSRIGMTGASGGGTQTILLAAVDARVNISAPVVMVSSFMYGGCQCEIGMPIHEGADYATNNAEIAAMQAPEPMLLVSVGTDWTRFTPVQEYPFIQRMYGFYAAVDKVKNVHFPTERHDNGPSKRNATLHFFADNLQLNISNVVDTSGALDDAANVIETRSVMCAFTITHPLPSHALTGEANVLATMRGLQPGWQPAQPVATVAASDVVCVAIFMGIAAIAIIARSRRELVA